MCDSDPAATVAHVAQVCQRLNLAYMHIMRGDFFHKQEGDVLPVVRAHFQNVLVANMGYAKDEANDAIAAGHVDAVAFGTPFLANPDLVARFLANAGLNAPDPSTFYGGGARGYTDYPTMADAEPMALDGANGQPTVVDLSQRWL
ncbi:Aste57867_16977 [Aphanomyces stellatus]|nr:hypothetical protein As57867_016919 [Aphanomyces stellatus]VFT93739.1 Aste57867_16977 [Aphanomyces stellatus]